MSHVGGKILITHHSLQVLMALIKPLHEIDVFGIDVSWLMDSTRLDSKNQFKFSKKRMLPTHDL